MIERLVCDVIGDGCSKGWVAVCVCSRALAKLLRKWVALVTQSTSPILLPLARPEINSCEV